MKRILVIRLGAIGDVILASAPLLNLKISFPQTEISFLTREDLIGTAEYMAGADKILPFPRHASIRELFRMGEYLDEVGYDTVLDLHGNLRSWYLRKHLSASIKAVYPKRRSARWAAVRLNRIEPDPPHTIDLYNKAVTTAGGDIYSDRPVLNLTRRPKRFHQFDNDRKIIGIAPGASYRPKQWPKDRYHELCHTIISETDLNIALYLSEDDAELDRLKEILPVDRLAVYYNVPLETLAYLIEENSLLVCNDSGLMHLGSAVGTPVIALFGPTHPTLGFYPRGIYDTMIEREEYCRPCSLHGQKKCFRKEQFCFTKITPTDVFEIICRRLERPPASNRALFLDRDGTLIKDKDYLADPDRVEPIAGSIEALKEAIGEGYKIIVISNQSGVARGKFTEREVRLVNQRVLDLYREQGILIDDILYCPYLKSGKLSEYSREHRCRKPRPGMIEEAVRRHRINPFESYVIGDKLSDVNLAYVTGGKGVLVRTGYGAAEEAKIGSLGLAPEKITDNLYEAVKYIIERGR